MVFSVITVVTILTGFVFTQTLSTNTTSSFDEELKTAQEQIEKSDPIVLSEDQKAFDLQFIVPNALKFIPEAEAANLSCDDSHVTCVEFHAKVASLLLPTGDPISFLSFDGQYPSKTIRVTQGDVLKVKMFNDGPGIHSLDNHGAQISALPNFMAVPVGGVTEYTFVAANAGVFVYHCEANNVFLLDVHALGGMSGMLIVDPKKGYQKYKIDAIIPNTDDSNEDTKKTKIKGPAREFSLVYGEWYLTTDLPGGQHRTDRNKIFSNDPSYTHVNGIPFGYTKPLLELEPWKNLSLVNVLTPEILLDCAFEGEGGALEATFCAEVDSDGTAENNPPLVALILPGEDPSTPEIDSLEEILGFVPFGPGSITTSLNVGAGERVRFFILNVGDRQLPWHIVGEQLDRVTVGKKVMALNVQTWNIAPYSEAIIDVVFEQPGVYSAVNHDYSSLFKGQASIILVHDGEVPENPSNSVPPPSALRKTSLEQTTCNWGIGAITENEFTSECT